MSLITIFCISHMFLCVRVGICYLKVFTLSKINLKIESGSTPFYKQVLEIMMELQCNYLYDNVIALSLSITSR